MAQSRVLLYVCYLLKNACGTSNGSSENLGAFRPLDSVMERFAAKALKELPHSIVRLLRALRPPLLLKRKTVGKLKTDVDSDFYAWATQRCERPIALLPFTFG